MDCGCRFQFLFQPFPVCPAGTHPGERASTAWPHPNEASLAASSCWLPFPPQSASMGRGKASRMGKKPDTQREEKPGRAPSSPLWWRLSSSQLLPGSCLQPGLDPGKQEYLAQKEDYSLAGDIGWIWFHNRSGPIGTSACTHLLQGILRSWASPRAKRKLWPQQGLYAHKAYMHISEAYMHTAPQLTWFMTLWA